MFPAGASRDSQRAPSSWIRAYAGCVSALESQLQSKSGAVRRARPRDAVDIQLQIHSQRAYDAISEVWSLGAARPLIIAGGPKAIYEPYHFWPVAGKRDPAVPDVVVTGEQYVLLELLNTLIEYRSARGTMRSAFEQARSEGALETIPGLVYLAPGASTREPALIDTGLQRLVRDLDELPGEETALDLLEPPHRGTGLSLKPLEPARVGRCARIVSLLVTQGCKFNCSYCPIPAVNQKSWRYRSPEALVRTISHDLRALPHQVLFRGGRQFFQSARDRRGVADDDGPFDGG